MTRTIVMLAARVPDESGKVVATTYVRSGSKVARPSTVIAKDIQAWNNRKQFGVLVEKGDDYQMWLCFPESNVLCWMEEELI